MAQDVTFDRATFNLNYTLYVKGRYLYQIFVKARVTMMQTVMQRLPSPDS